jgi:hypothetical protein
MTKKKFAKSILASIVLLSMPLVSSCAFFEKQPSPIVETYKESLVKTEVLFLQVLARSIYHLDQGNLSNDDINRLDYLLTLGQVNLDKANNFISGKKIKESQASLLIVQTVISEVNYILSKIEQEGESIDNEGKKL